MTSESAFTFDYGGVGVGVEIVASSNSWFRFSNKQELKMALQSDSSVILSHSGSIGLKKVSCGSSEIENLNIYVALFSSSIYCINGILAVCFSAAQKVIY